MFRLRLADFISRLVCAFAVAAAPAAATTLRLCTDEQSRLPFITPQGTGMADVLIKEAAKEVGITVEFRPAPISRCREEIRVHAMDGFPTVPYSPSVKNFMAFPMHGNEPDPSRAVNHIRALVFRRVGTAAGWDGVRFTRLNTPVLVPSGSVLLLDRLTQMGIPLENTARGLEANFQKLLAGRAELAVGSEFTGNALMAQPLFAGRIEALPMAFTDEPYYLSVSKRYRDANPDVVEKLWNAMARIRKSPAYQQALRKALDEYARTLKE
jgi:polar amino acid transport system substrate-binding protein